VKRGGGGQRGGGDTQAVLAGELLLQTYQCCRTNGWHTGVLERTPAVEESIAEGAGANASSICSSKAFAAAAPSMSHRHGDRRGGTGGNAVVSYASACALLCACGCVSGEAAVDVGAAACRLGGVGILSAGQLYAHHDYMFAWVWHR
jgi:hypothetical protein